MSSESPEVALPKDHRTEACTPASSESIEVALANDQADELSADDDDPPTPTEEPEEGQPTQQQLLEMLMNSDHKDPELLKQLVGACDAVSLSSDGESDKTSSTDEGSSDEPPWYETLQDERDVSCKMKNLLDAHPKMFYKHGKSILSMLEYQQQQGWSRAP